MAHALIHATSVHLPGLGGALLTGAPGTGKSDLALRLIDDGALLVADDQTALSVERGRLIARAPLAIERRMEVRGVGVIAVPTIAATEIDAVFVLVPMSEVERLPASGTFMLPPGLAVPATGTPSLALAPFESSAPAKVRAALAGVKGLFRNDTGASHERPSP